RHTELLGLRQLRPARLLADDERRGLRRHGVADLCAERLERRRRLVAREGLEGAGDDVRVAGEGPLDRLVLLAALEAQPELPQLLDERTVLVVAEPLGDRLGALRADAVRFDEL